MYFGGDTHDQSINTDCISFGYFTKDVMLVEPVRCFFTSAFRAPFGKMREF